LQSYTEQFERISGTGCRLEIIGEAIRLPIRAESCIYRLIEEALTNIATHAHATKSSVVLDYRDTTLCVTVEDDGCGFDQQEWLRESGQNGSHLGLLSMQERVEGLGGNMRVESAPGQGTRLTLQIPIERGTVEWNRSES
ncbi:MAG: ATP-binding protein, partial [Chloroflexota bacterium]